MRSARVGAGKWGVGDGEMEVTTDSICYSYHMSEIQINYPIFIYSIFILCHF